MTVYKLDELGRWNDKVKKRLNQAAQQATLNTANEANTPRQAGGRIPVVTGFLRNSIAAAIDRMPSGDSRPANGDGVRFVAGDGLAATIARWDPSSRRSLYVGWTAVYARRMEYRYGFLRGAVENWDKQVEFAAKQAVLNNP